LGNREINNVWDAVPQERSSWKKDRGRGRQEEGTGRGVNSGEVIQQSKAISVLSEEKNKGKKTKTRKIGRFRSRREHHVKGRD